jgi:acyl dehydratase
MAGSHSAVDADGDFDLGFERK